MQLLLLMVQNPCVSFVFACWFVFCQCLFLGLGSGLTLSFDFKQDLLCSHSCVASVSSTCNQGVSESWPDVVAASANWNYVCITEMQSTI